MEHRELEDILAELHGIADEDRPAFSARIRILRDRAGVPVPANVGKGTRRKFSHTDLWETHIALLLSEAGLPPQRVGLIFSTWLRPFNIYGELRKHSEDDLFLIIQTHLNAGKGSEADSVSHALILTEIGGLTEHFAQYDKSRVQLVMNASKATQEI